MYFATIVAAMIRCGRRITNLDDEAVLKGVEWSLRQSWLDDRTRALLADGEQFIRGRLGGPDKGDETGGRV